MSYHDDIGDPMFDTFDGLEFGIAPGSNPGDMLRRARAAKGLSLAEASRQTHIPAEHLEAIEAADYRGFKAPLYAIGFARSYARHLGLAEHDVVRAIRLHYEREGGPAARFRDVPQSVGRDAFVTRAVATALSAMALIALALLALRPA